ncbi:uncharacterized protein EV154DRAFT_506469 [Mucor mucedo]|uniref:uncharacterized protein n=1 Tax=Mucor mucedo TaxID=29922 RepID=UPI00221FB6ED|nr:uncharacterized protein EV154DRAFT_506469 [Mucor mucedo]KAI7891957.1 hypothetical protein EV154DRAFT_506469 [Mucor mucedo]
MLNPLAHDFKPVVLAAPPEQTTVNKPKKKPAAKKAAPKKAEQKRETPKKVEGPKKAEAPKKIEAKTEAKKKKGTKQPTGASHGKRRDSQANPTQETSLAVEWVESAFIAIEAAIDPIRLIDKSSKKLFEHGYERYIDWINRSLNSFDTVTLVGMENAIVDIVSLVTIMQDRKIAVHDDVETFTMNAGKGKLTSCIQVKLHSYF